MQSPNRRFKWCQLIECNFSQSKKKKKIPRVKYGHSGIFYWIASNSIISPHHEYQASCEINRVEGYDLDYLQHRRWWRRRIGGSEGGALESLSIRTYKCTSYVHIKNDRKKKEGRERERRSDEQSLQPAAADPHTHTHTTCRPSLTRTSEQFNPHHPA